MESIHIIPLPKLGNQEYSYNC